MTRQTPGRPSALAACAIATVLVAAGAALPARTAPPSPRAIAATPTATVTPAPARWPARARSRFAMYTPGGDRAMRAIVFEAVRDLRAGRNRDTVVDDVRARYQLAAGSHLEAYDGVVRRALAGEIDRYFAAVGYPRIELGLLSDLAS